jgi:tRNA (guanosine-2'-O-)-methyltransferase
MIKEFLKEYERTDRRKLKVRNVLEKRQPNLTLVLENVHDPHNVAAVLRTADCVGIFKVCLVYHSGQEFPKKMGKKSSGNARKWVNYLLFDSIESCYEKLKSEGKKIFTTHLGTESKSLYDLDLTQPVALVFGNEHKGLTEEALSLSDGNFIIPQVGMTQSLNISVACAVSAYEAMRQRTLAGLYDTPQLSPEVLDETYNYWVKK